MGPVELAIRDRAFGVSIIDDLEPLTIPDDFEIREKYLYGADLFFQSNFVDRRSDRNADLIRY